MTAIQAPYSRPRGLQRRNEAWPRPELFDEPLGFEAGDANLYRYVGNSPTNAIDPNGEESWAYPGGIVVPSPAPPSGSQEGGPILGALPPSGCPLNPGDLNKGKLGNVPKGDLEWYRDKTLEKIKYYKDRLQKPIKPGDIKNMPKNIETQINRLKNIECELKNRSVPRVPPRVPWWLKWGPPVWLYIPPDANGDGIIDPA